MWAQARYDLRLSDSEFWALTPRLFHLLFDRHRAAMVHREMLHAFTTAAVINSAPFEREAAALPLHYMPNHEDYRPSGSPVRAAPKAFTQEQSRAHTALQAKIFLLSAEQKRGGGELTDKIVAGVERL